MRTRREPVDSGSASTAAPEQQPGLEGESASMPEEHDGNRFDALGKLVRAALADELRGISQRLDLIERRTDLEDRLYRELEAHRSEERFSQQLPLIIDVIGTINRLSWDETIDAAVATSVVSELEEALRRVGIDRIVTDDHASFDPRLQRAVGKLDASAAVAFERVAYGYATRDRVIEPERVRVKPRETNKSAGIS